jgi:hypothetical protein
LEGLAKLKKSNYLIGIRTRDLPAYSIVPQPTTLPGDPSVTEARIEIFSRPIGLLGVISISDKEAKRKRLFPQLQERI